MKTRELPQRNFYRRLLAGGTLFFLCVTGFGADPAVPWQGTIKAGIAGEQVQEYAAWLPNAAQPVRAVIVINNMSLFPGESNWRELARKFNCLLVNFAVLEPAHPTPHDQRMVNTLDYREKTPSAQRIVAVLAQVSRDLPAHPEIQYDPVVLYGFSVGSAAVNAAASQPELKDRVAAVVALHEIDHEPYLPPPDVPHLFISSEGTDPFSPLLTPVEGSHDPAMTHDHLARSRATEQGALLTVVADIGHKHGGDLDLPIIRLWLEEVLSQRLPVTVSTNAPAKLADLKTSPAAWYGTYDVVQKTHTPPWGDEQRMTNVLAVPKEDYQDKRPHIWLPDEHFAKIWEAYAKDGVLP